MKKGVDHSVCRTAEPKYFVVEGGEDFSAAVGAGGKKGVSTLAPVRKDGRGGVREKGGWG